MVLDEFRTENGWILSRWRLTYHASWALIVRGVSKIAAYYDQFEVLTAIIQGAAAHKIEVDKVTEAEEGGVLVARGMSKMIGCPLSITFYNQLQMIEVQIAQSLDEFKEPTYESLSKSLGQYLDSVELYMLLPN